MLPKYKGKVSRTRGMCVSGVVCSMVGRTDVRNEARSVRPSVIT
jgi:hypothetical protein